MKTFFSPLHNLVLTATTKVSKSQLAILPVLTHYVIFGSPSPANTVIPFLDKP